MCPDHCYKVPESHEAVAQVIVALVVEQGALIIAAVLLLCQLC